MMKCEWMVWKRFSAFKELLIEVNRDARMLSFKKKIELVYSQLGRIGFCYNPALGPSRVPLI
jgi:hypothetical protein